MTTPDGRKHCRAKFPWQIRLGVLALVICTITETSLHAAGTWTQLTHENPDGGSGVMLLLTDGTIMVQGSGQTASWNKLSPDSSGGYINGSWSSIAPMTTSRLFFGSNMLPSGKVFVIGGEYSGEGKITNSGEIYDPVANSWKRIATYPQPQFGDDPTIVLPSGKVLCGYIFSGNTYLYDPVANSWKQTGTKLRSDRSDEETWLALPGGKILSYDVFSSDALQTGHAQVYNTSNGQWSDTGKVPVLLSSVAKLGAELGPGSLLPDGRVIQIGANNLTAIYTPSTNSWVKGPSLPAGMGADDTPGAMLPNGHFIFLADKSTPLFTPPTKIYDFDYTTNSLTDITPAGGLDGLLTGSAGYPFRMVVLPNGHVLLGHASTGVVWDYAPNGAPHASWAPTIVDVSKANPSLIYTLTGTQLTGISEGATYGDDVEMSSNYPIIRLKSSKNKVYYARTFNWTPGVATGTLKTTVKFKLPSGLPKDHYQLSVIANGIPSKGRTFIH